MKLYFVRHGETYLNKYGRMQGWSDAPLTEKGRESARECGKSLKGISFAGVITSDLGRTIETASIILKEMEVDHEIQSMQELRETFFGSFEGEKSRIAWNMIAKKNGYNSVKEFYQNAESLASIMNDFSRADSMNDAENFDQFWSRIEKGIEKIREKYKEDENILVVTHGNTIRNIACHFDKEVNPADEVINSGITLIEVNEESCRLIAYNQQKIESQY